MKLENCPICGKKAFVHHDYDSYDEADFGFSVGCPAYKLNDGIHDRRMAFHGYTRKEDAIKYWNAYAKGLTDGITYD